MNPVAQLLERLAARNDREALLTDQATVTYGELHTAIQVATTTLETFGIEPGAVVSLEGDFGHASVAVFFALMRRQAIIVPISLVVPPSAAETYRATAGVTGIVRIDRDDRMTYEPRTAGAVHPMIERLRHEGRAGLVVFSSGSTGASKAILHDLNRLLEKFLAPRPSWRTLGFLLFDHLGGLNTLLHALGSGGSFVMVRERSPEVICAAIARYGVELLPTSPTFLRLMLLSGAADRHDLSSLQLITYGTEVMPESTLRRLRERFPHVRLQQTYGLSELGVLRSQSRASDSLWVRLGGEGVELRVVDGLLEIKAPSAMVGYLNAPQPFTEDGFMRTEDEVQVDGDFVRILGRRAEVINVGGQKVFPAEVESVIQEMTGIAEVVVTGERHALMGQIVVARVRSSAPEERAALRTRVRTFCKDRLADYKVPQKIEVTDDTLHTARFKRGSGTTAPANVE
jgi:long-chain acyl-CoA synthetase